MKPRQFWVYRYTESDTEALIYNEPVKNFMHVQEVSPEREAAIEKMVEALEALYKRHNWHPDMGECMCQPHIDSAAALEAWYLAVGRKANETHEVMVKYRNRVKRLTEACRELKDNSCCSRCDYQILSKALESDE